MLLLTDSFLDAAIARVLADPALASLTVSITVGTVGFLVKGIKQVRKVMIKRNGDQIHVTDVTSVSIKTTTLDTNGKKQGKTKVRKIGSNKIER